MPRKMIDCRDQPSESNCTLTIAGEPDEVLRAATQHAISVHGHQDGPELREGLRAALKDDPSADAARMPGRGAPAASPDLSARH
ncbi:DUF1059 domain-containing protein [Aggregicoccus sp. 17bor-14]|uniref:DUF1059 domain-containing protein n=1 Tax=Myxococcaceae TaxID=31 RepID=UPI00129CEC0A|nr:MULTISPECIES: DUF1059 domain-containing protein [Myxococcaceae]MBF5045036.1 DUF1059 domain-containing protein [Simulacricoccus sp. 17bor-14]MRI90778.1 DUF1059 domain-containing protein [Aggregicoccus sp. 17bor-14]